MSSYIVTFRGKPACPCQVEWIPAYEAEAQRRGILTGQLSIYQLIGTYSKSGGTHGSGGVGDYVDMPGNVDLWLMRQMGADASWLRPKNWDGKGGIKHTHSVLTGCPHLSREAVDQIAAVRAGGDGLVGPGADTGPRPLSGRTWREGIAWAKEQEDDVPYTEEQLNDIVEKAVETVLNRSRETKKGKRSIVQMVRETFQK